MDSIPVKADFCVYGAAKEHSCEPSAAEHYTRRDTEFGRRAVRTACSADLEWRIACTPATHPEWRIVGASSAIDFGG